MKFKYDICIVGGVGHVGLPLGLLFKSKGKKVVLFDLDLKKEWEVLFQSFSKILSHGQSFLKI